MTFIDYDVFILRVRSTVFSGKMPLDRKKALAEIIDIWFDHYSHHPLEFLAYSLATTAVETNYTMRPVEEAYWLSAGARKRYFTRMYDIRGERPRVARVLGNIHPGDGALFPGRGLAQTTGRTNYGTISRLVSAVTGETVDFVKHPHKLLDMRYARVALFEAMLRGVYTGRSLHDYWKDGKFDAVGARRIINGTDRARAIAAIHDNFLEALRLAEQAHQKKVASDLFEADESTNDPLLDEIGVDVLDEQSIVTGRPVTKSKTIRASVLTGAGGLIAVGDKALDAANGAINRVNEVEGVGSKLAALAAIEASWFWIVLALVILGGSAFIIYDRWYKSRYDGV